MPFTRRAERPRPDHDLDGLPGIPLRIDASGGGMDHDVLDGSFSDLSSAVEPFFAFSARPLLVGARSVANGAGGSVGLGDVGAGRLGEHTLRIRDVASRLVGHEAPAGVGWLGLLIKYTVR